MHRNRVLWYFQPQPDPLFQRGGRIVSYLRQIVSNIYLTKFARAQPQNASRNIIPLKSVYADSYGVTYSLSRWVWKRTGREIENTRVFPVVAAFALCSFFFLIVVPRFVSFYSGKATRKPNETKRLSMEVEDWNFVSREEIKFLA